MIRLKFLALLFIIPILVNIFSGCTKSSEVKKSSEVISMQAEETKPAEPNKLEKKITIGVSLLDLDNIFISDVGNAMEAKAKELGVKLVISNGQNSAEKQVSQVENFIAQMVDVIILNPISYINCKPAIEAANRANIPILTVNTLVANQEKCITFVGSDAAESGRLEMEYAAKLLNGKGNIVILHGPNGHDAEIGRRKGVQEILDKNPGIKVIFEQSANWSKNEGYAIIENCLENGKEIDAVISQNDEMALGAVKAIEEKKGHENILVFGIDAIPDALKAIRDGKMAGTVFQDAKAQGAGAIQAAVKIAKGENVESKIYIPYVLVTKDDLSKYQK
jgi:inositol transport system substrate-binding protein